LRLPFRRRNDGEGFLDSDGFAAAAAAGVAALSIVV
jgi:hypothetical protein